MYLFFDTETTGLPQNWKAPVTDFDNWPRLVQIAWLIFSSEGEQIIEREYIVRPQGFIIPKQASDIHGITTEKALEEGLPLRDILEELTQAISQAKHLIAHNMSFDQRIIEAEFLRENIRHDLFRTSKICTKEASTLFCKIPREYGNEYKWPSLSELHIKLFGHGFEEAHDACADTRACAKCFFELKKLGVVKQ